MAKCQVAYWGEKAVDIYQMDGQGHARILCSGPLDGLKPISGGMQQRRILILGRNNVIRLRKQYPPMKMDQLMRAVEIETPTLFPMANCSFHCRIAETHPTHIIVDIWAWEREPLERIRAAFAFRYIIPEDLTFLSSPSGVSIYPAGSMIQVIAAGDGRFLDAASYPAADFSKTDLERFLTGLADHLALIKEIRFYAGTSVDVPPSFAPMVKKIPGAGTPPFLESLQGMPLKSFRLNAGLLPQSINRTVLLRFALYAVLAYGLMLFLTLQNYDKVLTDLKNKSLAVDKEISRQGGAGRSQEDAEVIKDVEVKTRETIAPLNVLNILASELPEETYVKSLVLNQGIVEAVVSAHDPIALLKKLSGSERIVKVSLKGPPAKEPASGIYNCAFLLEIKP